MKYVLNAINLLCQEKMKHTVTCISSNLYLPKAAKITSNVLIKIECHIITYVWILRYSTNIQHKGTYFILTYNDAKVCQKGVFNM